MQHPRLLPPTSEAELLARARQLDGSTVGELARGLGWTLRGGAVRNKGRIGELLELALGASASNRSEPDFPGLGVELKTVPLDGLGRVRESTFVCALDLGQAEREEWETSRVWRKLACVLWVPVEWGPALPLAQRHLGTPLLWRPTPAQESILRADWTEIIGRIAIGGIEGVSGRLGRCLQVRPKGRSAAERVVARGSEGEELVVMRRGFYLRARFTEEILWSLQPG